MRPWSSTRSRRTCSNGLRALPGGRRRRRSRGGRDLARAGAQPALRLRRPGAQGHRAELLLDRRPRGTSRTRRSRSRCGRPTRRSSTTAPAPSTSRAPRRPGATACPTSCRGVTLGAGRADRGRPPQGVRPPRRSRSSRRRRRSPRTCRARSASRSRSSGRGSSGSNRPGRRTRSSSAASAMPPSTTRRRRPASTAPRRSRTRGCRCRSSSSARTTGSGSACARPAGWVESALRARPTLRYEAAPGDDPELVLETARRPGRVDPRASARPGVLHLRTVRFLSHAGADVEAAYRTPQEIRADWDADPLLATGRWLAAAGPRSGEELADDYLAERERVLARRARGGGAPAARDRPTRSCGRSRRGPPARSPALRGGRGAGDARAGDQPRPRRRARARPHGARLRRGRRREGRRVRRHARAAAALRRGARVRHAARRDVDPRPRARHRRQRASCRSPRSSTSPTCTTPRTSCAARRRRSSSSRRASTGTGWSSGSPATATRRASAGTSTTTTRSACSATSPGSWSPRPARPDDAAAMLRTCVESARVDGDASASSSSRSRSTTRATCTRTATRAGSRPAAGEAPLGSARTYGDGGDLTIVTWATACACRLRVARRLEAQASARASSTSAGWRRCPVDDLLREADATGRVLVVDETRRTGGVSEGVVAALVDAGFDGPHRARDEQGLVHPARRRGEPRAPLGGRDRAGGARARRALALAIAMSRTSRRDREGPPERASITTSTVRSAYGCGTIRMYGLRRLPAVRPQLLRASSLRPSRR